ncbi:hypothetical protein GDO86_016148 [Hymenochirus boettgeri]|uniref:Uncharacterized protein n=1 Tax=Hymenochirus boettgeri TaxID=247094 RepID=A0A8T2K1W2_9PIPI|nr:hypothetical protein GDO86_016148 [Hymenochirus boettgeri]
MASSLVLANCSTMSVALQHIMAIEKLLKAEDPAFDEEAAQQVIEITQALKELEQARKKARESLEEQTIKNNKLRYRIQHLPGIIAKEIKEAVLSARHSNASELQELQNELRNTALQLEQTGQRQTELQEMNSFLGQKRATLWNANQQAIDLLNQQMAEKAYLSIVVNETHVKCKDAEDSVIEYKNRTEDLAEDMTLERQDFFEEKRCLLDEIKEIQEKSRKQEAQNADKKEAYKQLSSVLFNEEDKVSKEREIIQGLKDEIFLLQASHVRVTEKMDVQTKEAHNLANKKRHFEVSIEEMKDNYNKESNSLREKISKLNEELHNAENVHQMLIQKNKQLIEEHQSAREKEDKKFAKKQDSTKQLEEARAVLNGKMELYGKLKKEIRIMELETEKQLESGRLCIEQLTTHVEESRENITNETEKRKLVQVKKEEVSKDYDLWKLAEETFRNQTGDRIVNGRKKFAALTEMGNQFEKDLEKWDKEIQSLTEEVEKEEESFLQMEKSLTLEIQALQEEVNAVSKQLETENETLSSKIPVLKETEAKYNMETQKYEQLKNDAAELKKKQRSLALSIKSITKEVEMSLELKEAKMITLKNLRNASYEELQSYLSRILLTEKDLYEVNRRLELVVMENCRLKLCCVQLKEEIEKSVTESNTHKSAVKKIKDCLESLIGDLYEGWEKDHFVCKDFSDQDQDILDALSEFIKKMNQRAEKMDFFSCKLQEKLNGLNSLLDNKQ